MSTAELIRESNPESLFFMREMMMSICWEKTEEMERRDSALTLFQ